MAFEQQALSADVSKELAETLELVVDAIVESLGFEVVVVNLVDERDDSMFVAAVRGPDDVRELLLNRRQGRAGWQQLVDQSEAWGRLRFLDHATATADPDDIFSWRPDTPVVDEPDAWHPDDALFALLVGSDGRHLGMLSVDVPSDGKRPGPITRRALEAFAVTASLAIQQATLASERAVLVRHFEAVFENSPVAIAVLDDQRRFVRVNDAYSRFLGRSRADLVGCDLLEAAHPDDRSGADTATPGHPVEQRYLLPDGTVVWGRLHLAPLADEQGGGSMAQIEDVTDRKAAEESLVRQAHFDALTGLANRFESVRRLEGALAARGRARGSVAVLFCDLDRLKLVNDAHGHAVGDAYLREVSRRLAESVRDGDVVGRLSGDEFVVIAPNILNRADAAQLADRIVAQVRRPLRLAGLDFTPSLSIGISLDEGAVVSADELLAHADAAMYRAKLEERGSWYLYEASSGSSPADLLRLRHDVAHALEHEEFVLHYQPIVALDDGRTVGHEALLRWQHPVQGLLAPGQFLDVVLDSEYETPVTDWVLDRACRDAAARPAGQRRVSVNVSSVQVGRRDLPKVVAAALRRARLDPSELVLELTEDRLLAREDGDRLLQRLRDLGVVLAVDDFGTGYAGLSYLERFDAVGMLKLDRSFISSLGTRPASRHIVSSVVGLARDCGLQLVAEGVETREQARLLVECGVQLAQGYLFGRPAPLVPVPAVPAQPVPVALPVPASPV
ncbi:MAG: phosphodiesterase [Frankiales bacterium]|nr:phosphodiesterase [Frankiales bacterium]